MPAGVGVDYIKAIKTAMLIYPTYPHTLTPYYYPIVTQSYSMKITKYIILPSYHHTII